MYCERPRILIRGQDGTLHKSYTDLEKLGYEVSFFHVPYTFENEANRPERYKNIVRFPCGHCKFCLAELRREWTLRSVLEARLYDNNQFITLTYKREYRPITGIDKRDFSLFIKRLREYFRIKRKHVGIRFYGCADYDKNLRGHYHILLFNCPPFGDEKYHHTNEYGQAVYTSKILSQIWGKGYCAIGAVTRQSCDYVARHRLKSVNIKVPIGKQFAFQKMSTQPGIGHAYIQEHIDDLIADDCVKLTATITEKLPQYFYRQIEKAIGTERYENEVKIPHIERVKALFAEEMKRTGLTESELFTRKMNEEKEKLKPWIEVTDEEEF